MRKILPLSLLALLMISCGEKAKPSESENEMVFSFEHSYVYPGTPEFVYDHLTGDIHEWWDHTFSDNPHAIYIEAKPGGGFYEIFDPSGDGVLHATVIGAQRGKMLRMEGALGLAGQALTLVTSYHLNEYGLDSTKLVLRVHGAGEMKKDLPHIIESVWKHFLGDQFTPYIEHKFSKPSSAKE